MKKIMKLRRWHYPEHKGIDWLASNECLKLGTETWWFHIHPWFEYMSRCEPAESLAAKQPGGQGGIMPRDDAQLNILLSSQEKQSYHAQKSWTSDDPKSVKSPMSQLDKQTDT